jgi:CheY-like chemotaxis protein
VSTDPATTSAGTILAVEDEPLNRRLLHAVLGPAGYEIIDAGTLAEARIRLRERTPDIVLLDLRLPDGDGLDLCREIRADPAIASIPVVAATASAMPPIVDAAYEAGVDGFLAKPIRPGALLEAVQRHIADGR